MKDSKNLALMFLLGAFLTGGVLGFTANGYMKRDQVCTSGNGSTNLLATLSERLRLSSDQQHTVDSILDDRSRQYRALTEPIRPQVDAIKENAREQIRRVLTEEQKREFQALIEELNDSTRTNRDE
ncbi:MAG: hypothetical protein IPF87_17110 [Gemmatimonadetes bacterium]|jgi:hypothetical protein|nr:hypothetical protein [Gemmatimonadota bacterium]HNV75271.1 hypothetical protein [Gemmatimonadaceae bacterium]MBK6457773.1 hypothetical protein [Gemmatimonadota bacterium]MBK7833569.1 hypothetical protein [Gemmatimonadota bacterium]MBK8646241.1 hypothetical protein [Gemmatimonadota bacterium]